MVKTIIAFIPARSGSSRIANKNIKPFHGHPLIKYSIAQAKRSGIFQDIWVSSDSMEYLHLVEKDCKTYHRKFPTDHLSPDIDWISSLIAHIERFYKKSDYFAILRPTSPFRKPTTIKRAWEQLLAYGDEFD